MGENILVEPPLNNIKYRLYFACILGSLREKTHRRVGKCGQSILIGSRTGKGPYDRMFPWCPSLALNYVWDKIVKTDLGKEFHFGCPYSVVLCP